MLQSKDYELAFVSTEYESATDQVNTQIKKIDKIVKSYDKTGMVIGEAPLMKDLQDELGLSYLFISHDIAVVEFMADDMIVMKHGKVVEAGDAKQIIDDPQDPYTRALIAAVPIPDPTAYVDRAERRAVIAAGVGQAS